MAMTTPILILILIVYYY